MKPLFWLFIVILGALGLNPSASQAQADISLEIQAGFDALYKTDAWTPIRVTLTNHGSDLQAELRIVDDNPGFGAADGLYVYPVDLPGQSRKKFTLYAPLRGQNRLTVEVTDRQGNLLIFEQSNIAAIGPEGLLVGIVASDSSLLNGLARFKTVDDGQVAIAHLNLEDLPASFQVWSGLDMLVFNDVDTAQLSPAQLAALQSWVRLGGNLIIGGGPNAAQTISGLASFLPFATVEMQTISHPVAELQQFSSKPLEDRGLYVTAIPVNTTGNILAGDARQPLIVLARRGAGQVYYVALDFSLAPFDRLAGDPLFLPAILDTLQAQPESLIRKPDANLIRSSLGIIPDLVLPTPMTVIIYLIAYVLVIGPINYLVLSRLKRREWAWFTIPIIILLFSSYSYFSSFRLRGGRPLVRQITVMQAATGSPLAQVTSFIGIYTPQRADYGLKINYPLLIESLPDSYAFTNEIRVTAQDSTVVENLQGDIGGLPAIIAHGETASPQITVSMSYNEATQRAKGAISNHTGQPIHDALLIADNALVELGTLPAGEIQVDQSAVNHPPYEQFYEQLRHRFRHPAPQSNSDEERQLLRLASRDMAIRALFGPDHDDNDIQPAWNPLYLVGWQEGSFLEVELTGSGGDAISETMLLIQLPSLTR